MVERQRHHPDVPYSEKGEATTLGARWDPAAKRWLTLSRRHPASTAGPLARRSPTFCPARTAPSAMACSSTSSRALTIRSECGMRSRASARWGLLRSYPSSVLIAVHEPVHELLTARTSGAHCGASSSDDAPGRSQCGHQRPDYGSEGHSVARVGPRCGPVWDTRARCTRSPYLAKIERDTVRDTKLGRPATLRTILRHGLSLL